MLPRRIALVLIPLLLTVAACGDDDTTPTPGSSPSSAATATVSASPSTAPTTPPSSPTATDGTVAPENPGAKDPVTTKSNPDPLTGTALLKDVRMGIHPENGGWERIVFEFQGGLPPAEVKYVPSVASCGSGMPVTLEGSAILQVRFSTAAQHNDAAQPTFAKQQLDGPGNTILEAKQWCDFEAVLGWAMGLKGEQNFKVTTLQGPPRLVIDIKQ